MEVDIEGKLLGQFCSRYSIFLARLQVNEYYTKMESWFVMKNGRNEGFL